MERYAVSSFALSIAGIAQAVGNAMNGQHWLAYVWCGAGWVIVYEVVLYSKWGLPKRAKIGIIVAIAIISFSCVAIATGYQNIKLEIGKQPTPNSMGHKYVHVPLIIADRPSLSAMYISRI